MNVLQLREDNFLFPSRKKFITSRICVLRLQHSKGGIPFPLFHWKIQTNVSSYALNLNNNKFEPVLSHHASYISWNVSGKFLLLVFFLLPLLLLILPTRDKAYVVQQYIFGLYLTGPAACVYVYVCLLHFLILGINSYHCIIQATGGQCKHTRDADL